MPASSFAVGNENESIARTPNNTSRLVVVQNRPVVAGEALEFQRRAPKW